MSRNPHIRPAVAEDLPDAAALLEDAGLPVADLAAGHLAFIADLDGKSVGVVGFEHFDEIGLLRSLVVAEQARFAGLGRRLVAALEQAARDAGVRELWLLTQDAENWFAALGYVRAPRSRAPASIRGTAEFTDLCPDDAALMRKPL